MENIIILVFAEDGNAERKSLIGESLRGIPRRLDVRYSTVPGYSTVQYGGTVEAPELVEKGDKTLEL